MAYDFVAASSQYLLTSSAPVTDTPLTMAAIGKPNANNVNYIPISLSASSDSHRRAVVYSSSANVNAQATGTFSGTSTSTNSYSAGVYSSVAGVFASITSRTAYLSGVKGTENTTNNSSFTAANEISIGARRLTTFGVFMDGQIAEAAVWSVALTDAEVASLAKGFKPTRIRPQSLVFYAPLIRNLQDTRGGLSITNNNSATVANHPRVY